MVSGYAAIGSMVVGPLATYRTALRIIVETQRVSMGLAITGHIVVGPMGIGSSAIGHVVFYPISIGDRSHDHWYYGRQSYCLLGIWSVVLWLLVVLKLLVLP